MMVNADVSNKMQSMFNNIGAYGSIDGPRYIAAQSRHVFAGGGINFRVPRDTYQLISATGPSLSAGCGGIDLYSGSFSFINKDQFVQMLNNIAANSVGLAFKTALCSTSANLCQAIEDLQRTIQQLNRFNIDSCESAKKLVGGFMGSAQQTAQAACQANSRSANLTNDASEARDMCGNTTHFNQSRKVAASGTEEVVKPIEFVGGNITWEMLLTTAKNLDNQDKEMLMSMIGTHIISTVTLSFKYHPPSIKQLTDLNDKTISMLKCKEYTKCLEVSAKVITLSVAFLELAKTQITDIRNRINSGRKITDYQMGLIASSPIPLLALVQADLAGAVGLIDISAEAIAYAISYHYLSSVLRQAATSAAAWKSKSVNEAEILKTMIDDSRKLRNELAQEMHVSLERVGSLIEINERMRGVRQLLTKDKLSAIINK